MPNASAYTPTTPPRVSDTATALIGGILDRRVTAWLLDAALLFVLGCVLWVALLLLGVITFGVAVPLLGALPLLPLLYGTLSITSPMSPTPRQAMLGLVVRRDEDFGDPGLARAFATVALFYVTFWASILVQVVALLPFTGRRLLHDMLSGTVVVRAHVLRDHHQQRR